MLLPDTEGISGRKLGKYQKKLFTSSAGFQKERARIGRCPGFPSWLNIPRFQIVLFVLAHIHPPVTRQRQTLNIGRSAHFSLQWLLRGWRNPHLLRSFQWSKVPVNSLKFLSTEFAACTKPPSRDNHRKASYPRMQQRDQGTGRTQIMRSGSS